MACNLQISIRGISPWNETAQLHKVGSLLLWICERERESQKEKIIGDTESSSPRIYWYGDNVG